MPEHFNWPWLRLLESSPRVLGGISATWHEYPAGTGAMAAALDAETLDIGMLLTEGAVAGIGRGGRYRIVSLYTRSPLVWGIHVPASSRFEHVEDLRGARYAISRLGSGSHLMAFVLAKQRGWPTGELVFETVGGLDGAVEAFAEDRADVFLWEKFMTKPVVDAGRFRRVGELAAPWPAFVVCASDAALRTKRDAIRWVLELVLETAAALHAELDAPKEIARRYGLLEADAATWLAATRWAERVGIDGTIVDGVATTLAELGLFATPTRALTAQL